MGLIIGGVSARDLILDGHSVSLYVGGSPPVKVWPTQEERETVQITLGSLYQARDQLRAALADRGLNYQTVTRIPFDIELLGSGSAREMFFGCKALTHAPAINTSSVTNMHYMFNGCSALTHAPDMDTSGVTNMHGMFYDCSALTYAPDMDTSGVTNMHGMFYNCAALTSAPDMDTSQVTDMGGMFYNCAALTTVPDLDTGQVMYTDEMFWGCMSLTDGNVRLIGRHPQVDTTNMIYGSGLTRLPFYDTNGNPI